MRPQSIKILMGRRLVYETDPSYALLLAIRLTLVLDDDEERTIIYLDTWRLSLFIAHFSYQRLFNSISYLRFF